MRFKLLSALALLVTGQAIAQVAQIPNTTEFKDTRVVLNQSLANAASITGNYSNPAWITSLDWSKILNVPSFESPITFGAPLSRASNTVSLAPCGTDGFILKWRTATSWGCEDDQTITGGTGITSIGGLTVATQNFANDTNVTMSSSGSTHTLGWTGTLAASRLNSSVVHAITNDTNVTGSISAQTLTISWAGTLSAARLNSNVVQAVTNDTNVQGSIAGQTLTIQWSGALAKARQNAATVYTDQANAYSAGSKQTFTSSATTSATNFAPYAGDPSTLFDGDHWYNSAAAVFKARIGSTTKTLAFTDSNITGNAATASALASTPTLCPTGQAPTGVLANGNATGCAALGGGGSISGLTAGKFPVASNSTTVVDSNNTQHADGSTNFGKAATWASAYAATFNSGGTTTCDLSQSNVCLVAFGSGNTTLAFTNPHGTGPWILRSCQDATGGRQYTFAGTMKGFFQPDPGAGTTNCTEQPFTYDGTNYQGGSASVPTSAWHGLSAIEGTAPTCITGYESIYADSTAHRWKVCHGSSGPYQIVTTAGGDINTSDQVVATHLAAGLPRNQGGLNSTSAGTGLLRDGTTPSASELSGDCVTSGSNATICTKSNGVNLSFYATATGATNAQTSTYQVLAADFTNLKTITVASGTFTITLVASGSQPAAGQWIEIINYGSGVVTIARSGQNINGGTSSLTLAAGSATAPSSARVLSDGTNYFAKIASVGGSGTVTTSGSPSSGQITKFSGGTTVTTAVPDDLVPLSYVAGGGTANAQTATYSPAVSALSTGLRLCWLPTAANTTTTPTFAPNGLTARTIVKAGGAVAASDLLTTAVACAIYNASTTQWELQNPQTTSAGGGTPGGSDKNVQYNNSGALGGVSNSTSTDPGILTQTNSGTPEFMRPIVANGGIMTYRSVLKPLMLRTTTTGGTNYQMSTTDTGHTSIVGPIPYTVPKSGAIDSTLTFTNLGSGGTNGTGYNMSFSGGSCSTPPAGTYDIASNVISNYAITNPGVGCSSGVTVSFPNGGISGAAATVTVWARDRALMVNSISGWHTSGGTCLLLDDIGGAGTVTPLVQITSITNGGSGAVSFVYAAGDKPNANCTNNNSSFVASGIEIDATSGIVSKILTGGSATTQTLYTAPAGTHAALINRGAGTMSSGNVLCMNNTAGTVTYTTYFTPQGGSDLTFAVGAPTAGTITTMQFSGILSGGAAIKVNFGTAGTATNSSCWATFLTDTGSH